MLISLKIIMINFIYLLTSLPVRAKLIASSEENTMLTNSQPSSINFEHKAFTHQLEHLRLIRASIAKFANRTLVVCVVEREPFVIYDGPRAGNEIDATTNQLINTSIARQDLNNYSGVAIEVTKRLADIFKFKVRITSPSDGQFGVQNIDGQWTGLMGSLVRNESELGVTALSITSKRADYVDFTRAYFVETASVLLRTPDEIRNFLVVLEPFSPIVWCLLFVTIVFLIIVITIMTKLEDNQRLKHDIARAIRINQRQKRKHREQQRDTGNDHRLSSLDGLANVASVLISHVLMPKTSLQSSHSLSLPLAPQGVSGPHKDKPQSSRHLSKSSFKWKNTMMIEEGEEGLSSGLKPSFGIDYKELQKQSASQSEFGSTWLERSYYSIACVLNILLNKDIKHPPRQSPIRILVCVWWLSTIIIVNFYLGTLFEQLVLPRRQKLIDSLEELVGQDAIKWSVTSGSALQELFLNANEKSIYWWIGRRMQNVSNADEGVRRVLDSNAAFIRERSILTFKLAQEHRKLGACKMQLAREEFFSVGFGLALPKESPYLEPFNAALTLMIENGFVARWQNEYWPQRSRFTECQSTNSNEAKALSLKHFLSIYLVWALFICLAFLVLVYQHGKEASMKLLDSNQRSRVRLKN